MKAKATLALLAAGAVATVFLAGFFHEADSPAHAKAPIAAPIGKMAVRDEGWHEAEQAGHRLSGEMYAGRKPAQGFLAMTNTAAYKRAADFSLRVADCTQAEDDLETKLQSMKGEILEMVMEGTEGSRTCTLSVLIPSDQFRGFVTELRKMGKVQSERITASKLKPGEGRRDPAEEPDPRELSLVNVRMADEKVAQSVLESRGVLASSFDRSASHFMKGLAVIVELLGYVLPFAAAFIVIAVPFLVIVRIRRARAAAATD